MSKLLPLKNFGIPVNAAISPANHIVAYYGTHGYTPAYGQSARKDLGPISALPTVKDAAGNAVWQLDLNPLPDGLSGSYDFAFTDMDANGDESDFSPVVTVTVDTVAPLALGQPEVLS